MSLMVRYVDQNSLLAKTKLVQLIHVDATDCSAKRLVEEFEKALEKKAISLEQLIGLACDNASVMVGKYNSFKTHLIKRLSHLMTLPCICHSLALIAKEACSAIPEEIQSFISKIPTFINSSPKRLANFNIFQRPFEDHPSKLLRFASTRWLSRQIAITRILDNWENLRIFSTDQVVEKVASAVDLLAIMNNPMTKVYLLFLKFAIDPLEKTNAHFQGSATLVHQLQPSSKKLLIDVLQKFMKPALLKPEIIDNEARNIDFGSITNQRDALKVDVGDDCKDYLQAELSSEVSESIID
ncbi:uncharacterized protein LOC128668556 [Microplitis demolitor]|uniref:uncharacterized protein LOC128668556 n=1 Tax=Microplitis demolitor TaxID=69319 RepID=UPI0004CCD945|nr:uncharacterized protein LOC128668556 [Microplitis demolitor]